MRDAGIRGAALRASVLGLLAAALAVAWTAVDTR